MKRVLKYFNIPIVLILLNSSVLLLIIFFMNFDWDNTAVIAGSLFVLGFVAIGFIVAKLIIDKMLSVKIVLIILYILIFAITCIECILKSEIMLLCCSTGGIKILLSLIDTQNLINTYSILFSLIISAFQPICICGFYVLIKWYSKEFSSKKHLINKQNANKDVKYYLKAVILMLSIEFVLSTGFSFFIDSDRVWDIVHSLPFYMLEFILIGLIMAVYCYKKRLSVLKLLGIIYLVVASIMIMHKLICAHNDESYICFFADVSLMLPLLLRGLKEVDLTTYSFSWWNVLFYPMFQPLMIGAGYWLIKQLRNFRQNHKLPK